MEVATITRTEHHENSTRQVRVFIVLLALGTSAGAACLLVWAATEGSPILILFGLLTVGMAAPMIYGVTLLCGHSDGAAMQDAAQRRARVPEPPPETAPAPAVRYRRRPQHVVATRR